MTKPTILITNDDGIHAPGIRHLCQAVCEFADVILCAPQGEKSGSGLAITWTKPLHLKEVDWKQAKAAWSVSGTPADCVKMALSVLMEGPPTLILSGINAGSNAGRTVLYSGTVGGVIEGALRGIPGIAFSYSEFAYAPEGAVHSHIQAIVKHFLNHPFPYGTLLNVTFPPKCEEGIQGIRMAGQGRGYMRENPDKRIHPEGNPYYWLGGKWDHCDEDPESDVFLLGQGYATITPIHVSDLCDRRVIEQHKDLVAKL